LVNGALFFCALIVTAHNTAAGTAANAVLIARSAAFDFSSELRRNPIRLPTGHTLIHHEHARHRSGIAE
jgi:hypothetical protein